MYNRLYLFVSLIFCSFLTNNQVFSQETYEDFTPGKIWKDNNGIHINAHGGGIVYSKGLYYWFGEHKIEGEKGNTAQVGVHCYSSKDLYNWKDEALRSKFLTI